MNVTQSSPRSALLVCTTLVTLALTACGGGGGASSDPGNSSATLTIKGTVSNGSPVATTSVQAQCAAGTDTQNTNADGNFTLMINNAGLPCILAAKVDESTTLHSAIASAGAGGNSVTANITPVTEMIVAAAAGSTPAAAASSFDATTQGNIKAHLGAATGEVKSLLASAGVTISGDPLTSAYTAATDGAALAALQTALNSAQTTITEITTSLAAGGSGAAVAQALQPSASTCKYLHSGDLTAIDPYSSPAVEKLHLNAETLTLRHTDGSTEQLNPVDGSPCAFTQADGTQILVSQSGVATALFPTDGGTGIGFAIPAQDIPLTELAGEWNEFGFDNEGTWSTVFTLDAAGKITAALQCAGTNPCTPDPDTATLPALAPHSEGGYTISVDGKVFRIIPHKTADGRIVMFQTGADGGMFSVATTVRQLTRPSVTDAPTKFWRVMISSAGLLSSLSADTSTIHSVDSAANSYTRSLASSPSLITTQLLDQPRTGIRLQPSEATTTTGAATTTSRTMQLSLGSTGMQLFFVLSSTSQPLGLSIIKP